MAETVYIAYFTARGGETATRIARGLNADGWECRRFAPEKYAVGETEPLCAPLSRWAGLAFARADALVFVGAAGIAVRAVAPWLVSKREDPAVVVCDEAGRFAVSLLSGHIGGANELAEKIAALLGATPVITTATDVNGIFAVDVFARKNRLRISDMGLAKEVSAALLGGVPVGFWTDLDISGPMPPGFTSGRAELGVCVSEDGRKSPFERTLKLIPMRFAAGVGCRRGIEPAAFREFFLRQLAGCGVEPERLMCIASIDVKKDEPCLLALCRELDAPFRTFSARRLGQAPGEFSDSRFVRETVGVGCVCERAAVLAAGGLLVREKTAEDGMTFALAKNTEEIRF